MNMNTKRALLFKAMDYDIKYWSQIAADRAMGKKDLSNIPEGEQYRVLQERLHTQEDISAFRDVVQETCQSVMFDFLCLFDGVVPWISEHFTPALVDPETGEDLAPNESTYHDEFNFYYYTHKDVVDFK